MDTSPRFPEKFYTALNQLKNNRNIVLSRADKGSNIVILNSSDYITKCKTLLNTPTYEKLTKNPNSTSQSTFNSTLSTILKNYPHLQKLKAYMTNIPQFYRIPKTHKQNTPLRPIISNTNSNTSV